MLPHDSTILDGRGLSCRVKHPLVFQRWYELPIGGQFILINDHDPVPLYHHFCAEFPGAFNWESNQVEPNTFHVTITRLGPPAPAAP